jgi:hypothetical protein
MYDIKNVPEMPIGKAYIHVRAQRTMNWLRYARAPQTGSPFQISIHAFHARAHILQTIPTGEWCHTSSAGSQ